MKPALNEIPLPKYIAIEGPIGVGKTTLANKIAETFNYDAFLEQPAENPFLKNFYRNPSQSALATQLFFLFQRMQQIQDLKQRSLFENVRVADFLIEKDAVIYFTFCQTSIPQIPPQPNAQSKSFTPVAIPATHTPVQAEK